MLGKHRRSPNRDCRPASKGDGRLRTPGSQPGTVFRLPHIRRASWRRKTSRPALRSGLTRSTCVAELARPQCLPIATPRRQRWDRRRPQGSNAIQDILGHGDCGKVAEKEGPLEITAPEPARTPNCLQRSPRSMPERVTAAVLLLDESSVDEIVAKPGRAEETRSNDRQPSFPARALGKSGSIITDAG